MKTPLFRHVYVNCYMGVLVNIDIKQRSVPRHKLQFALCLVVFFSLSLSQIPQSLSPTPFSLSIFRPNERYK